MAVKKKAAPRKRSIQNPAVPLTAANIMSYLGGGAMSASGVVVNPRTALTCSPVWQAIDVITSDVSILPFLTYKRTADGRGKERADDHPVYALLRRHTGEMTSNLWIARVLAHALLYGNGYSRIYWRGNSVQRLEFLHRDWVEPVYDRGARYYLVRYPSEYGGDTVRVPYENMFHVCGLTIDPMGGLSLVDFARNTIGRQMGAEHYADDFFSNDATPSGFFVHPGEMSEDAQERFISAVERRHRGGGNRGRFGVLEEGMQWMQAGINPQDAMLVDQLKLGVMDVARFFNLPPHKLGDASRVNYNSLESEEKAYRSGSLGKWISRFEFEASYKLFLDSEIRNGYFAEFLQDAHAKADTAARYQAYSIAVQWGIMSRNEVRERENLNPYDGGDEYLTPLTHQEPPADEQPTEEDRPPESDPPKPDGRGQALLRDLICERLDEAARLLVNSAIRAAKDPSKFLAKINDLSRFVQAIDGITGSALRLCGSQSVANRMITEASSRFVEACECQPEDLLDRVTEAGEVLRAWVREVSINLVYGEEQHAA